MPTLTTPRPTRPPHPPRSRRRRRLLAAAVGLAVVVLAAGLVLRSPAAPVGYFTSGAAQDRFRAAYARAMADLPAPQRTLDIRTSFGIVRVYRFTGAHPDKEPLLLLPGRSSAAPVWADNLPSLLQLRDVYALDLLGEPGFSVQDRPITTDDDHAAWLHEVLTVLPEPRLHLLGVSIGGWTAANLATRQPGKIASVTLLEPVFVFGPISTEAIVRSIPASVRWFPKAWRDDFASWTAGGAPGEDVPVAQLIEAGMQSYVLRLSASTKIPESAITGLDLPVLVILGGRSPMHDAAAAADTARRLLPASTVTVYPDATHAVNGEYPDRIAADLNAFLPDY